MTALSSGSPDQLWVKICGITRPEDAQCAIDCGVNALGFVFVPTSRRGLDLSKDLGWIDALAGKIERVGLFLDAPSDFIEEVLDQVSLDTLQFHGNETPGECEAWDKPYLKALGLADRLDERAWQERADQYASAHALLIDSHASGQMGGTGQVGDWRRLQALTQHWDRPWILAGGLSPDNVIMATEALTPSGIDLSSGVESEPGIKDHGKIEHLMRHVRSLDRYNNGVPQSWPNP